ncbi:MAG: aspartate/glutamate racemase family protein [Candidatus Aenigmarchaeota archaeon]|nr:aspartate/glutamate racemase family protein [Candidatus Aenigmarchaeota archaeon]
MIGGLGPESTAEFYLNLTKKSRKYCKKYPSIVIDSISFPFILEKEIMQEMKNEDKILPYLISAVKRLNKAEVDFIVMPCNTLHIFINNLREKSNVLVLSIIDETVNRIKNKGYKKVGLLATTKTIHDKIYEIPLKSNNIEVIKPNKKQQDKLQKTELKILENKVNEKDKIFMKNLVIDLMRKGSEAIVLGCTDLQLILKDDFEIEIIDSLEVLTDSTFKKMIRGGEKWEK